MMLRLAQIRTWHWLLPWAALLVGVFLAAGLDAADLKRLEAEVTVNVRPDQAFVATPITVQYAVQVPKGTEVRFPPLGERFGDLDVRDVRTIEDVPIDATQRRWILQVEVEALQPGTFELPPIEIEIRDPDNPAGSQLIRSPKSQIVVRSVLDEQADPARFRDIKPVVFVTPESERDFRWVWWTTGVGVVSLSFVAFMLLWRRDRGPSNFQWAIQALADLEQRHLSESLDGDALYVQLTNIVRLFLEREFEIGASRLTTPEFLVQVQTDKRLTPELQSRLKSFLETADRVKFAAWTPDGQTTSQVFEEARNLINDAYQIRRAADEQRKREEA